MARILKVGAHLPGSRLPYCLYRQLGLTPRRLQLLNPTISQYRDRRFQGTQEEFDHRLHTSTTLYIGNLSFYTTEEQILEVRRPL